MHEVSRANPSLFREKEWKLGIINLALPTQSGASRRILTHALAWH